MPKELNLQQHCCQNLKCWILKGLFMHLHWCHLIPTGSFFYHCTKHSSFITQKACMYRDIWWQLQMLRTVIKETHCTFRCEVILLLYSVQPTAISRKERQTCHQYTDWWHVWFITQLCRDLVFCTHTCFDYSPSYLYAVITSCSNQKLWNLHHRDRKSVV